MNSTSKEVRNVIQSASMGSETTTGHIVDSVNVNSVNNIESDTPANDNNFGTDTSSLNGDNTNNLDTNTLSLNGGNDNKQDSSMNETTKHGANKYVSEGDTTCQQNADSEVKAESTHTEPVTQAQTFNPVNPEPDDKLTKVQAQTTQHPQKVPLDTIDEGSLCMRCAHANEDHMLQCIECDGWSHCICTMLPAYHLSYICNKAEEPYRCQSCLVAHLDIASALASQEKAMKQTHAQLDTHAAATYKVVSEGSQTIATHTCKVVSEGSQTIATDTITGISALQLKATIEALERNMINEMQRMYHRQKTAEAASSELTLQCKIERLRNQLHVKARQIQDMRANANEGMRKENTKIKEELAKVRVEIEHDQREHKIEMKQIKVEREQFMNENHSERRMKNLAENNHQQAKVEIVDLTKQLSDMKQQLNEGSESIYQLKLQLQGLSEPTGE